eukprot:2636771-Pyramimonas_sp.AAC.1
MALRHWRRSCPGPDESCSYKDFWEHDLWECLRELLGPVRRRRRRRRLLKSHVGSPMNHGPARTARNMHCGNVLGGPAWGVPSSSSPMLGRSVVVVGHRLWRTF